MAHTIKINLDLCTGCQMCVDGCFVDVIRWDQTRGKPFASYPEDCQVCCICEKVCPPGAIEIIPDWSSKYYPRILAKERK